MMAFVPNEGVSKVESKELVSSGILDRIEYPGHRTLIHYTNGQVFLITGYLVDVPYGKGDKIEIYYRYGLKKQGMGWTHDYEVLKINNK